MSTAAAATVSEVLHLAAAPLIDSGAQDAEVFAAQRLRRRLTDARHQRRRVHEIREHHRHRRSRHTTPVMSSVIIIADW